MKNIRDEIKRLDADIFVLVDESVAINKKIKELELEKEQLYKLEVEKKYELLNILLRHILFKKFPNIYLFNNPYYKKCDTNFHYKGAWFCIYNKYGLLYCINNNHGSKYISEKDEFIKIDETVFQNPEVQEFTRYVIKNYDIVHSIILRLKHKYEKTNLYDNYNTAVTFLLCNRRTKTFLKEIANIIANKILFFRREAPKLK
jgi:hypothetical protein